MLPVLFDGFGGVNMTNLTSLLDEWEIRGELRRVYYDKALLMIDAQRAEEKATRDAGS